MKPSLPLDIPELTIVIPAFNEAGTIRQLVNSVLRARKDEGWAAEVLVVNDGSTDATADILSDLQKSGGFDVLTHPTNQGKGAAIRTAMAVASGTYLVIQDADLEYDPRQITHLLRRLRQGDVDAVYGSRVLGARAGLCRQRRNLFALGVWLLNWTVRWLYHMQTTDEATCYKLFRTSDLQRMELCCERFEFCPEVTAKASRLGLKVVEIPISYSPRSTSDGKKIGAGDALSAFWTLWKYRNWSPESAQKRLPSHDLLSTVQLRTDRAVSPKTISASESHKQ